VAYQGQHRFEMTINSSNIQLLAAFVMYDQINAAKLSKICKTCPNLKELQHLHTVPD